MSPQITLFHHGVAPNPPKVAILLEELGISYELIKKEFGDGENGVKAPDYLAINPNGRLPSIIDHTNNDKIIWESGAILIYLTERFDKSGKYGGENLDEKAVVWEWLMLQLSGLGPILGQVGYFKLQHPVKDLDPSVINRFKNETLRVFGVLEKRLENREWIALNRFTIAGFKLLHRADLTLDEFPRLKASFDRISQLPSVETAYKKLLQDA
ncbi:hypothetical protein Clacol_002161 [Clathrus columnatus]|uniref:Glutathione S-transferase n=1 Tax=Clathrus columnatus TaxID=1419009 RepID=A0AAV5A3X0_9AGAM|nr:hypothetical protein Clacol_002161 [Clathrus columnatus]